MLETVKKGRHLHHVWVRAPEGTGGVKLPLRCARCKSGFGVG